MNKTCLLLLSCLCLPLHAAENWLLKLDRRGNPSYMTLHIAASDGRLSGTLDGDAPDGRRNGDDLRYTFTDSKGRRYAYAGRWPAQDGRPSACDGAGGPTNSRPLAPGSALRAAAAPGTARPCTPSGCAA